MTRSTLIVLGVTSCLIAAGCGSAPTVPPVVQPTGLDGLIHAVYGVDTQGTKAQKISLARDLLLDNREQEPVFMVGDSLSDILAAKEASVTSIAVTWGHQGVEILLRGNPDYVVSSPHQLIEIIEQSYESW